MVISKEKLLGENVFMTGYPLFNAGLHIHNCFHNGKMIVCLGIAGLKYQLIGSIMVIDKIISHQSLRWFVDADPGDAFPGKKNLQAESGLIKAIYDQPSDNFYLALDTDR